MCIKLIRHFLCSATVDHTCEYLARCSNPTYMIEDMLGISTINRGHRPCLDKGTLETREEWYEQACPDCTGENMAPKVECAWAIDHDIPGRNDDYRHKYFNDPHLVPDDDAVSVYVQNLAYWLLSYLCPPDRRFANNSLLWLGPLGDGDAPPARREHHTYVINELLCQVAPEHGFLCQIDLSERGLAEGRRAFGHQLAHEGCPCPSTQKPWLCNWALYVRREAARGVYLGLTNPDCPTAEANYDMQEQIIEECEELGKDAATAAAAKGPSAPEALPVLEIQHPPGDALVSREWVLWRDARLMAEFFEHRIPDEDDELDKTMGYQRHVSRTCLLPWAAFILMHDSGLTLRRAREILALFAARVVRYDPRWRKFKPQVHGYDACERLATVASQRPWYVEPWVKQTLGPLTDITVFHTKIKVKYVLWQVNDRGRVSRVRDNIVTATDAEFQALRESGDTRCPICFEDFDDHVSALSKNPVQNRLCHGRGNRHWMNAACLVRLARTLYNPADEEAAPPPRCPICRTVFDDIEPKTEEI